MLSAEAQRFGDIGSPESNLVLAPAGCTFDTCHCPPRAVRTQRPAYQKLGSAAFASMFLTFETCPRPPRAVLMPRPFNAEAIPR
jgi:hypothetical protein